MTLKQLVERDMEEYFSLLLSEDDIIDINSKVKAEQDRFDRVYLDGAVIYN